MLRCSAIESIERSADAAERMGVMQWLHRRRMWIEEDLDDSERRWLLSPSLYLNRHQLVPALVERARGTILDVGCGRIPYLRYLDPNQFERYDGLDIERRSPHTRFIGDARDMREIPDAAYDTVVAFSSLEHVPDPRAAMANIRRVARPGGVVIITVPMLFRLHEEPHDYYRFTRYSLQELADAMGFQVERIEPMGGFFTFLAHQCSTVLVCTFWRIPILQSLAFWLNAVLFVRIPIALDRALRTAQKFPSNYLAIFTVPGDPNSKP